MRCQGCATRTVFYFKCKKNRDLTTGTLLELGQLYNFNNGHLVLLHTFIFESGLFHDMKW